MKTSGAELYFCNEKAMSPSYYAKGYQNIRAHPSHTHTHSHKSSRNGTNVAKTSGSQEELRFQPALIRSSVAANPFSSGRSALRPQALLVLAHVF